MAAEAKTKIDHDDQDPGGLALPDVAASAAEAVCTELRHRQLLLQRRRQLLLQCAEVGALDEARLAELLGQLDVGGDAVDAAGAEPAPAPASEAAAVPK
jgi:hypothetical protein